MDKTEVFPGRALATYQEGDGRCQVRVKTTGNISNLSLANS